MAEVVTDDSGRLKLTPVNPAGFRSRLENYGPLMKYVSMGPNQPRALKPTDCSKVLSEALLAAREVEYLPGIRTISTGPVAVEEDGKIKLLGDGYHEIDGNSGILVINSVSIQQMKVSEAVKALLEIFEEFSFVAESDRARAIALLLSPALKAGGFIHQPFPIHLIEANASQTGKGFMAELVSAVYGETPGLVGEREGGVGSFDESISRAIIGGRPFILLDNIRGRLKSAFLEMLLTMPGSVPCRVPYQGELEVDASGVTFLLTSNGIEATPDLANRANIIRLRKRAGVEFRRYPDGDILDHVRGDRARYVSAIYAVLAEWVARGKQHSDDLRGQGAFRTWWRVVDYLCREIFGMVSPLDGMGPVVERTANPGLQWLREVCVTLEKDGRIGTEFSASGLAELSQENALKIPGVPDDYSGAEKVIGGIMRRVFQEADDYQLDDWLFRRVRREVSREDGKGKREIKFYKVQKAPLPPSTPLGGITTKKKGGASMGFGTP